ncbi:hypothetical protein ACN47E_004044 [Coniothyrium glycines]
MATTARAAHSLEVPSVDDMDMNSDNDIDFGDGDIELDLDPLQATHREDDDVSVQDAASVSGQAGHMSTGEQDDFMADNEDLIEEDVELQGADLEDDAPMDQSDAGVEVLSQYEDAEPVDEDLVDYSDEEGNEHDEINVFTQEEEDIEVQDFANEGEDIQEPTDELGENKEETSTAHDQADESPTVDVTEPETQDHDIRGHVEVVDHKDDEEVDDGDGGQGEEDDGGVLLHDTDNAAEGVVEYDEHDSQAKHENDHEVVPGESKQEEAQSAKLQPVTVNYAGNELWLFKEHDPDDSGDWLLEDTALAKVTVSELFHACRASLGDDVSQEHEIGFRFDHLHNLELYEDNTACVAVSLERLVQLYYTLHAQDGNDEPDSFYMSLLFRPRFATLLSDVAKYAEQGSGFTALNAAINAGDTHFTNIFSGASTDEPEEWGNEESAESNDDESNDTSPDSSEKHEEQSSKDEAYEHDSEDGHEIDKKSGDLIHAEDSHDEDARIEHEQTVIADSVDNDSAHAEHYDSSDEEGVQVEHHDGDLVDYGDEETVQNGTGIDTTLAGLPQSPSTVQGDELETFNATIIAADHLDAGLQQDEHQNDFDFEAVADFEHSSKDEEAQAGHDPDQSYQDFVQDQDENDAFDGPQTNSTEGFTVGIHYEDNHERDHDALEYLDHEQQPQVNFLDAADYNESNQANNAEGDFVGSNDFLDLENAPEWNEDFDLASEFPQEAFNQYDDANNTGEGEDGAAERPALAASSFAEPAAASTSELQELSPQGQKRSVDEAGHGADDALDSTDAKRPRVESDRPQLSFTNT